VVGVLGRCKLAVGSWQLAVGSWQLAVGSWQLAKYFDTQFSNKHQTINTKQAKQTNF
jgi:hypothetical protein